MKHKLSNSRALRIIDSAQREFAREGFEGARVDRIAKSAGVNKQLLFYYYQSKQGLFRAVLGRRKVYEALSSKLTVEKKETEISALFAMAAACLALLSAGLSLVWFNRIL